MSEIIIHSKIAMNTAVAITCILPTIFCQFFVFFSPDGAMPAADLSIVAVLAPRTPTWLGILPCCGAAQRLNVERHGQKPVILLSFSSSDRPGRSNRVENDCHPVGSLIAS